MGAFVDLLPLQKSFYGCTSCFLLQVGDLIFDKDGLAVKGLLVRHLVLPQNQAGSKVIADFLADHIGNNYERKLWAFYNGIDKFLFPTVF